MMQPTTAEWLSNVATTKQKLEQLIEQASPPNEPKDDRESLDAKLQTQGRIINSEYWLKDDPRINQWLSYPGIPFILQRTQTVLDLLEEIKNQAPQISQEMLSPASFFDKSA